MKKVILINASPRKKGNSNAITERLTSEIRDADVETFIIREKSMNPCLACGACRGKDEPRCVQKDDMSDLIAKIEQCDALVLTAPIYFHHLNGPAKTFIDRLYCFYNPEKPMGSNTSKRGKKAVIICSCGSGTADVYTKRATELTEGFSFVGADETKVFTYATVGAPGSCLENEGYAKEIRSIAEWINE